MIGSAMTHEALMTLRTQAPVVQTPATRFRIAIEEAQAAGIDLSQRVLQLTYGDSAKLKRDPSIPDGDIRFENGAMAFIGVRVVEGASASSLVDINGIVIAPDESQPAEVKAAKGQKKSNKEVRKPKADKKAKPAPAARDFTTPPEKRPKA